MRIEVKMLPCRCPELGLTCFLLTSVMHGRWRLLLTDTLFLSSFSLLIVHASTPLDLKRESRGRHLTHSHSLTAPACLFQGVTVKDVPGEKVYPMPISATGEYNVEVGRIRKSLVFDNGLDFFVCGDQVTQKTEFFFLGGGAPIPRVSPSATLLPGFDLFLRSSCAARRSTRSSSPRSPPASPTSKPPKRPLLKAAGLQKLKTAATPSP